MKKIRLLTFITLASMFVSYTIAIYFVQIMVYQEFVFTLNYGLLFFDGNPWYFLAVTLLSLSLPIYIILTRFTRATVNDDNYSGLMTTSQTKRDLIPLSFDDKANLYLTAGDKRRITLNALKKKYNKKMETIGLSKLKVKTLSSWFINGELVYKRCGLPIVTKKGKIYLDMSDSHNLILGTTNSGKSWSLILIMLSMMAITGESGMAVDVKGELSEYTANLFKAKGFDVYFIDFIDIMNSHCWDPLHLATEEYFKQAKIEEKELQELEKKLDKAMKQHKILHGDVPFDPVSVFGKNIGGDYIYNSETSSFRTTADYSLAQEYLVDVTSAITHDPTSKERFWNDEAAKVLYGLLYMLLENKNSEQVNFASAAQLLVEGSQNIPGSGKTPITYLKAYLEKFKSPDDKSFKQLSSYVDGAANTSKSVRQVLEKSWEPLVNNDNIMKLMAKNDIPFDDIGKKKIMIFLKVHDEKQTYYPLITLFIKQLWQVIVRNARTSEGNRLSIPFNIIEDEMGNFPPLDVLGNIITAGRSRGVRFTGALQGYDQLDDKYGDKVARTLKGNMMNTVYLLSGDDSTKEEISKRSGTKKIKTIRGKDETERNLSVDRLGSKMKLGEAVFIRQRKEAFVTKLLPFDSYNFFSYLTTYKLENRPKKEPERFHIIKDYHKKIEEMMRNGK